MDTNKLVNAAVSDQNLATLEKINFPRSDKIAIYYDVQLVVCPLPKPVIIYVQNLHCRNQSRR
jgi:hypothetical protein